MKKLIALILLMALLLEALPLNALAEGAESFMLSKEELERYVKLYGWDDESYDRWHDGMSLSNSSTPMITWSFADKLENEHMLNVLENFRLLSVALEEAKERNETPSAEWLKQYQEMYTAVLDLQNELSYAEETMSTDMAFISANADTVWDTEFSMRTRFYTSMRIEKAVERIRENMAVIQANANNWAKAIADWEEMFSNTMNIETADPFMEGLRKLLPQKTDEDIRIFEAQMSVPQNANGASLMSRLSGDSGLSYPRATVFVMSCDMVAIKLVDKSGNVLPNTMVTTINSKGERVMSVTSPKMGIAYFHAKDFNGWGGVNNKEIYLDIEIKGELRSSKDTERRANYHHHTLKLVRGEITTFELGDHQERPYVYGVGFNGYEIFHNSDTFYYSKLTKDQLTFDVDVYTDERCSVYLTYCEDGNKKQTAPKELTTSGSHNLTFTDQWLMKLEPGEGVAVHIKDQNGNITDFDTNITIKVPVVDEPFTDSSASLHLPWSGGGFNVRLPKTIKSPIGNSIIGFDLPFMKYIPRFGINMNGAGYFVLGMSTPDALGSDPKIARTASKKLIDEQVKRAQRDGYIAVQRAKAQEILKGSSREPMMIAGISMDISIFVLLQGKYQKISGNLRDQKGRIAMNGVVGFTFSTTGNFTWQLNPLFFLGGHISASVTVAGNIGVNVNTTWDRKTQKSPHFDSMAINYAATGISTSFRLQVGASVGAGMNGIASISVNGYGFIEFRFNLTVPPSAQLYVGAGAYALLEVLFIKWKVTIWDSGNKKLFDTNDMRGPLTDDRNTQDAQVIIVGPDNEKPDDDILIPQDLTLHVKDLAILGNHIELAEVDGMMYAFYLEKSGSSGTMLRWYNLTKNVKGDLEATGAPQCDNVYDFCVTKVSGANSSNAERYIAIGMIASNRLEKVTREVAGEKIETYEPVVGKTRSRVERAMAVEMGFLRATKDGGLTAISFPTPYEKNGYNTFSKFVFPGIHPEYQFPNAIRFPKEGATLTANEDVKRRGAYHMQLMTGIYGDETGAEYYTFTHGIDEKQNNWGDPLRYASFKQRNYSDLLPEVSRNQVPLQRILAGGQAWGDEFSRWYDLTDDRGQMMPGKNSKLYYYQNDFDDYYKEPRRVFLLDGGNVSNLAVSHGLSQMHWSDRDFVALQTDRAFYLRRQEKTDKLDPGFPLNSARVTSRVDNQDEYTKLDRINLTDYGVLLPTATLNVATMRNAPLVYWLESAPSTYIDPEKPLDDTIPSVYRVCGSFYDPVKDIMTSKLTIAKIVTGDKIPVNLTLASDGRAYYTLCKKNIADSGTTEAYSAEIYSFQCSAAVSMELKNISMPSGVMVKPGGYLDVSLDAKNTGNTPIAKIVFQAFEGNNTNAFESIVLDIMEPDKSTITLLNGNLEYSSNDKVAWRVDGVNDPNNGDNWVVTRKNIFGSGENAEAHNIARLLMPGDEACYHFKLMIPPEWEGEKVITLKLTRIYGCIDWAKGVVDYKDKDKPLDDVPLIEFSLQPDGSTQVVMPEQPMADDEESCWPLDIEDYVINYAVNTLDTDFGNLWLEGRTLLEDGSDTVMLTVGSEAEWNGKDNHNAIYITLDDDESTRRLLFDADALAKGDGLTANKVVTISTTLGALIGDADPEKIRVEIVGDQEEMVQADNVWELQLRNPALKIVVEPEDQTIMEGSTLEMYVEAEGGNTPYRYQWQMRMKGSTEWQNIIMGTDAELTMEKVKRNMDGSAIRCVITDEDGTQVTSRAASLTVKKLPHTGDVNDPYMTLILLVAAGVMLLILARKRKHRAE